MIRTPRLVLRPWHEADKPGFSAIINTPAMMVHFGGVQPRATLDGLVDRMMAAEAADGHSMWAVDLRGTGELVGICGVRRSTTHPGLAVNGLLEIGWRIAERWWGRGIAREAAQASLDWAWANTPDPLVAAWTNPGNTRSWGLMQRLGMHRRSDLDFRHELYAADDPLGDMIVYVAERP